jgi:predicted nucleic acid-binding protein
MSTYVLDASVAVAAVRRSEPSHAAARARLALVLARMDHAIVPATFDAEVTSALVRAGVSPIAARRYLDHELAARQVVTIGPRAARAISAMAARTRLRAADAAYVWLASARGLPLVTLDKNVGGKASGICPVEIL